MQYLVREVRPNAAAQANDIKIFKNLQEVMKHLQKVNQQEVLHIGDRACDLAQLQNTLKERLATVVLNKAPGGLPEWAITAFE